MLCGIPFSVYKVQEEDLLTFISFFCCLEIWSHTLKIAKRGADLQNTLEKGGKYFYFLEGGQVRYLFQLIRSFTICTTVDNEYKAWYCHHSVVLINVKSNLPCSVRSCITSTLPTDLIGSEVFVTSCGLGLTTM